MSERITRVLVSYDKSNRMNCKYESHEVYETFKRKDHEWVVSCDGLYGWREEYKPTVLPPHIGVYFESGVYNKRIFYKKISPEPLYLYHAKDDEEYKWVISRGIPFQEKLCESFPTTSYQPSTTMFGMGDVFVVELLVDKDEAKKNVTSEAPDSYFEINRINKINELQADERKLAISEEERVKAEEKLSANKAKLLDDLMERLDGHNTGSSSATKTKKVRSSA